MSLHLGQTAGIPRNAMHAIAVHWAAAKHARERLDFTEDLIRQEWACAIAHEHDIPEHIFTAAMDAGDELYGSASHADPE